MLEMMPLKDELSGVALDGVPYACLTYDDVSALHSSEIAAPLQEDPCEPL